MITPLAFINYRSYVILHFGPPAYPVLRMTNFLILEFSQFGPHFHSFLYPGPCGMISSIF